MKDSKEVSLKNSISDIIPVTKEIDNILSECQPIMKGEVSGMANSLILAKGIFQLKAILYENENLKKTIQYMQDSKVGFMTDRSPAIIEAAKRRGKAIVPYTYNEIADCVLYALLFGYNLYGKEFYVIAGNFYASQFGKYRHIMENRNISDFHYANSPPIFKTENRAAKEKNVIVPYAEVECFASWYRQGKKFYLGNHPDNKDKDPLVFKIKVDAFTGDDGVVGKALSKLFTRVLNRLSCNYIEQPVLDPPEPEEIEPIIEVDTNNDPTPAPANKPQRNKYKGDMMLIVKGFNHNGISEEQICHYFNVDDLIDLDCRDGLLELSAAITTIEGGDTTKVAEFIRIAAERKEMREASLPV
jgi:hypothetical protein